MASRARSELRALDARFGDQQLTQTIPNSCHLWYSYSAWASLS